jgi:hypothetical protein
MFGGFAIMRGGCCVISAKTEGVFVQIAERGEGQVVVLLGGGVIVLRQTILQRNTVAQKIALGEMVVAHRITDSGGSSAKSYCDGYIWRNTKAVFVNEANRSQCLGLAAQCSNLEIVHSCREVLGRKFTEFVIAVGFHLSA